MVAAKTITDPLYGSISLTETEAKIVSSKVFQRLHNVRQLGLAHLVFPSAGYSRFAHCIGACHNASRMISAIAENSGEKIEDERRAAYRVAALLHDLGHYPFSHTTEHTLADYYANSLFKSSNLIRRDGVADAINHEDVGALVLANDEELHKIFKESRDVSLDKVVEIFSKGGLDPLFGIISSELDCDRLDYLGRTSHMGGVPYGGVDVDFIIGKATLGPDSDLAFESKAAKAIDHFLISRYYDYMQMVHHKTVEALEWSLSEAIKFVLDDEPDLLSKADVERRVADGSWCQTDDSWLISKLKDHEDRASHSAGMSVIADHLRAVLYRRPAKRVWKWESIRDKNDKDIKVRKGFADSVVRELASDMGLDTRRFWVHDRIFKLVKLSDAETTHDGFDEEKAKSVRIKARSGYGYLVERQDLLMQRLARVHNFSVNIYYLPVADEDRSVREDIRKRLDTRLKDT